MEEIIIDGVEYVLTPKQVENVHSAWRLPTITELLTLVNYEKYNPASNLEDTEIGCYWSISTYIDDSDCAWYVCFFNGVTDGEDKGYTNYVRCVRTSNDGKLEWSSTSSDKMTWHEALEYARNLVAPVYYKDKE